MNYKNTDSKITDTSTVELPASECWALVRSVPVGRLAVLVDGRPDIFPVNHVVDHGTVVVRTGTGTKLAAADRQPVAFEVDGYDVEAAQAWSAVIKGVARTVDRMHEVVDALQLPIFPWQGGPKPCFLRIEPESITGRRITVQGGVGSSARSAGEGPKPV
ncbi:pyridoxamine 5'-phosphate oxidase family protein [Flexivirga sp.]|uniref:pyridoxamine 5'-phosphate oxidase family protein n=1 Tax=Flexivirga sp. TaxID=1962927 RepID=UPI003F7FC146